MVNCVRDTKVVSLHLLLKASYFTEKKIITIETKNADTAFG